MSIEYLTVEYLLDRFSDLRNYARIPVNNGRYAIGVMDEWGLLQEGQVFFFPSDDAGNTPITGKVMMSRSPALHPGDVRVLEAVDVPGSSLPPSFVINSIFHFDTNS
jgi:hypothetical protein